MPTARPTRAALVVVNYGSSRLLDTNLGTMEIPEDVSVVVVDCFTTHEERARVRDLCRAHGWEAVLCDTNLGFGGGMNTGAERALDTGVDVIVALNPDATVDAASLTTLAAGASAERDAIVSPRIFTGDGRVWFDGADLYLDTGTSAGRHRREAFAGRPRREWANGACFAMSSDLWRRVDGFDDDYFLYWEDIDLSHRVLDAGGRLIMLDEAVAVHDEGQTSGRAAADRAKSSTYYYYNIRNRLLYAAKHLDDAMFAQWLRNARLASYRILLQGGRRQLLSPAPWRAYRRGLRDGRTAAKRLRG